MPEFINILNNMVCWCTYSKIVWLLSTCCGWTGLPHLTVLWNST